MPLFKYYVSARPSDPSPAEWKLSFHEADSMKAAVQHLIDSDQLPRNWQSMWIHFLVWVDQEGKQRGFESVSLANFAASKAPFEG
jgi:hypothetical protein